MINSLIKKLSDKVTNQIIDIFLSDDTENRKKTPFQRNLLRTTGLIDESDMKYYLKK